MTSDHILQIFLRVTIQNQIRVAQRIIVDEVIQFRPLCHSHVQRILFLLEQFLISPNERTEDYNRRIIDTFVNRIEITDTEMLIYFNLSEASASEKQKNSQPNSCSTGNHLVRVARIELTPLEPHCAPLADTLVKAAHNIRYITNFRIHFFILFRLMSRSFVSIVVKLWSNDLRQMTFIPC